MNTADLGLPVDVPSTALFTDQYELTMLRAALKAGTAERRSVFEVFTRRLPDGRRYGVVAGTGRVLDAVENFRFDAGVLRFLRERDIVDEETLDWLAGYRFSGDIWGYPEGEVYFPGSPIMRVEGTFGECVLLETVILSILNHDSAIAAAASRMASAAGDRPLIEMGARRTHELAAVAAARSAYVGGFATTSDLAAGFRYNIPTVGTSAHAFTLLHDNERDAFQAQVNALGRDTTLLVDTYDVAEAVRTAVEIAGPELGAVRIDSGDLLLVAHRVRQQLDELGATDTKIVVTSDLDEYAIASLAAAPVDAYGVGTQLVTGSGHPTASMVYKLVARAESGAEGRRWCRWRRSPAAARPRSGAASGPPVGWTPTGTPRPRWSAPGRCPTLSPTGSSWSSWSRAARWSPASRWTPPGTGTRPPAPTSRCPRPSSPEGNPSFRRSTCTGARVAKAGAVRPVRTGPAPPARPAPSPPPDALLRPLDPQPIQPKDTDHAPRPDRRRRAERLLRGRQPCGDRRCRRGRRHHRADRAGARRLPPRRGHPRPPHRAGRPLRRQPRLRPLLAGALRGRHGRGRLPPELRPGRRLRRDRRRLRQGAYSAAYSGFEGTDENGTTLADWLRAREVDEVDVVGIATDHCVRATALDAAREGFRTQVLLDLTAGVAPETTERAVEELREAGVELSGKPVVQ